MDILHIEGKEVRATSPEGRSVTMSVEEWVGRLAPPRIDTGEIVIPDGLKWSTTRGPVTIWFHQTTPRPYSFKWIAKDSPAPYGNGAKYRQVRLSLPYLVTMAVFVPGENGHRQLSMRHNEAFFRNDPIDSLDDELCYPALLNCSKFNPPQGRPLSWICTQHLQRRGFVNEKDENRRMWGGLSALLHCLLETGFNDSSEHHEGASWFGESRGVDPRLASVEAWEAATTLKPHFALDVPWLPTGHSLRQVAERTFNNLRLPAQTHTSAATLAGLVYNHTPRARAASLLAQLHENF
jgi:hypothetical protein